MNRLKSKKQKAGKVQMSAVGFFHPHEPASGDQYSLPYGGELLPVKVAVAISGCYKPGCRFSDAVCRADDGRYYLAREVQRDHPALCDGELPRFNLPKGLHWLRVKRLTFRGAVLAVLSTCGASSELRCDLIRAMQKEAA